MTTTRALRRSLALLVLVALIGGVRAAPEELRYTDQRVVVAGVERTVRVPEGFVFEVAATGLAGPRLITIGPGGDMFIGSRSGNVYRLQAPFDRAETLVQLPGYPHSVAFRDGEILIARTSGLYRAPYAAGQAQIPAARVELVARLPSQTGGHNSRTVKVGPDGRTYVALGIAGNCSDEFLGPGYPFERQRGGIAVLAQGASGPVWEPFGNGLRNPVGFAWRHSTGAMYMVNNGPDHLGFEEPREYFSKVEPGSFHGMPWYQLIEGELRRDNCQGSQPPLPASQVVRPSLTFDARNAPMAVEFVAPRQLGGRFTGDAVVALRGSWATDPTGGRAGDPASRRHPKLVLVRFESGNPVRIDDLVTGFQLPDGQRWARPVGVVLAPDGALYFTSDEGANFLFRLRPAR